MQADSSCAESGEKYNAALPQASGIAVVFVVIIGAAQLIASTKVAAKFSKGEVKTKILH
jgi:hypothetical protein